MVKKILFRLAGLLSYSAGSRLISALASISLIQKTVFKQNYRAMVQLKKQLGLSQSVGELTHRNIVSTVFDPWRIGKLGFMDKAQLDRWVTFENLDLVQGILGQGQGILFANVHVGMSRFLPLAMARRGTDIVTLEADPYYKRFKFPGISGFQSIEIRTADGFFLKAIFKAKKVLKSGKALLMAPDGLQGMGDGTSFPFLNKERSFFGTFTSLAEQAGAHILVGVFDVANDGKIKITFKELASVEGSPQEMRDQLLKQYVTHVESIWREDISSVQGRHLVHYLAL